MKTKKQAEQVAQRVNAMMNYSTLPNCAVSAAVVFNDFMNDYAVEISPDKTNQGEAFHHVEALADITRAFGLHCHLSIKGAAIIATIF